MLKHFLIAAISFLFFDSIAYAQERDTSIIYIDLDGRKVVKEKAEAYLVVLPPDSSVDVKLYIVEGFYKNGKKLLLGTSINDSFPLIFQGPQTSFFQNGHKMRIINLEQGLPIGNAISYFPNGKLYNIKKYEKGQELMETCQDSTGKMLAKNGQGKWIEYDSEFKNVTVEGKVKKGLIQVGWKYNISNGYFTEEIDHTPPAGVDEKTYTGEICKTPDIEPKFPGGMQAFGKYLAKNMHYPASARKNNIQGRVIVGFIVEENGRLANIHLSQSVSPDVDREALRIIALSPSWIPAKFLRKPVAISFQVPIIFALGN